MGYARTKLEEATDRVAQLEKENAELQKCAAVVQVSLEKERNTLKAKLEAAEKAYQFAVDNGSTHSDSDYEALQKENEQLKSLLNKTATEASFGYCAALVVDGAEMPRTGYGDGWNAAMAKITKILEHQDDEAWVIREAYDRVDKEAIEARKENEQLRQANDLAIKTYIEHVKLIERLSSGLEVISQDIGSTHAATKAKEALAALVKERK